jgi:hypothetical protein
MVQGTVKLVGRLEAVLAGLNVALACAHLLLLAWPMVLLGGGGASISPGGAAARSAARGPDKRAARR